MIEPKIDDLLAHVDSKYSLVILAAKRAREINSYYSQLGEGRGGVHPAAGRDRGLTNKPLVDRPRGDRRGQDQRRAPRGASTPSSSPLGAPGAARRHGRHRRVQGRAARSAARRAPAPTSAS